MTIITAERSLAARASEALERLDHLDAPEFLHQAIKTVFRGRIALISSFGTESALLLALVAEVDRSTPVLFIDTLKLFQETIDYRDALVDRLGLSDVRTIKPSNRELADRDPQGLLWQFDTDACCKLRKVEPLVPAQTGFDALISGRKRYHGALRRHMRRIELVDGIIKLDPVANWPQARVATEFARRGLPEHPLKSVGYPSVGCEPCTAPVGDGEDIRSGRWAGSVKTECGIHLSTSAIESLDSSDL